MEVNDVVSQADARKAVGLTAKFPTDNQPR